MVQQYDSANKDLMIMVYSYKYFYIKLKLNTLRLTADKRNYECSIPVTTVFKKDIYYHRLITLSFTF